MRFARDMQTLALYSDMAVTKTVAYPDVFIISLHLDLSYVPIQCAQLHKHRFKIGAILWFCLFDVVSIIVPENCNEIG